jgi:hypothetical protein
MVPPAGSTTDQETPVFAALLTVAVKRNGAPVFNVSAGPATETVIPEDCGALEEPPPHPTRLAPNRQATTTVWKLDLAAIISPSREVKPSSA